jgi:hypothetical protein
MTMGSKIIGLQALPLAIALFLHMSISSSKIFLEFEIDSLGLP